MYYVKNESAFLDENAKNISGRRKRKWIKSSQSKKKGFKHNFSGSQNYFQKTLKIQFIKIINLGH